MKLLVAVPAYNEELSIKNVIENIQKDIPESEILVIDDGSSDATAVTAQSLGVKVISLPFNIGVGGAMRVAFRYAYQNGFNQVLQVDADGQHIPSEARKLLNSNIEDSIVLGSRFSNSQSDYSVSGARRFAMKTLAKIISFMCKTNLTDVTSGFRLTSGKAIKLFANQYPREYLGDTVESLIIAHKNDIKIIELPVSMAQRELGTPSQNFIRSFWYLIRAMLVITLASLKRN